MTESAREAFRSSARDVLGRRDHCQRTRELRVAAPGFERPVFAEIAEAGWLSVLVPEDQGGLGLGLYEVTALAEQVGRHLLPEPFVAAGVHAIAALCELPDGSTKRRLLGELCAGRMIAGLAWAEAAGAPDDAAPSLKAERNDGGLRLYGRKVFVTPGPGADGWLVTAAGSNEPELYWVPADAPGLQRVEQPLVDGSYAAELRFDGVPLAPSLRLAAGAAVYRAVAHANDVARIAQGAELLGIARYAFERTLEHLGSREQFGRKIGSFQALQHRMVDAHIQLELAAACIDHALRALGQGRAGLPATASRIKARCARAALGVTRLAIQLHGALGYSDEYDVGLYFKRALAIASWLGGEQTHARRHLTELPDSFEAAPVPPTRTTFPRDADWEAMPEAEFRQMVRDFLVRHYPPHLRHMPHRVRWQPIREWYLTLSHQGWIAPAWPKAFGGMELPADKLIAFIEEQERYGVARPPDQGLIMLGPVLMRFGTPAQQQRFLPKILSGEHVWCQGYSEPNAGSDLASLRTSAVLEGDVFRVNGQKTWTTLAQDATHMFMLVRTGVFPKKQQGISFLLVDLATPGVSVRPLRSLAGDEELCEVFFDDVRVPRDHLVGELHGGWAISKALLGFERIFGGSPKNARYALEQLSRLGRARGLFDDAAFALRYASLRLDVLDLTAVYESFVDEIRRGEPLSAGVSLLKIWATETHERIGALLIEAAEEHGAQRGTTRYGDSEINVSAPLLNALAATIFSGTNEIQRNILARQVLGLPES